MVIIKTTLIKEKIITILMFKELKGVIVLIVEIHLKKFLTVLSVV